MTTFDQDETGLDSGNPLELYRFYGDLGSYTYTSGNRATLFAAPSSNQAEAYKPIPLQRTEIILGDVTEKNELKITLPKNLSLISDYVFDISPTDDLVMEIYRQHGPTGQMQLIFYGIVAGFAVAENKVTATCPSSFSNYLGTSFPNVYFQSNCNHVLYGPGCGVSRDAFTVNASVLTVSEDRENITFQIKGNLPTGVIPAASPVYGGTYAGIQYNYSDMAEWGRYLSDYPDVAAEANKQVGLHNFPNNLAYAAWHYLRFGMNDGHLVHPSVAGVGAGAVLADGWLNAGELIIGTERRLILTHIGNALLLNYPFRRISIGDEITMFAGCLHNSVDCLNKFNNGDNFLGFEYIPYINPFEVGIA